MRHIKTFAILLLASCLLAPCTPAMSAEEKPETEQQSILPTGKEVKEAFKAAGKGPVKAGKQVGKSVKELGKEIGQGAKAAGKSFVEKVKQLKNAKLVAPDGISTTPEDPTDDH